jgi:RhtB (resistance to homoserine/threonine) family protein
MFQFYTIAIIALLAAVSPGPDFVVVTKNALSRSRGHALSCTLGVCLGILFHSSYCVMGLALLIAQSVLLFTFIKYLGALYLIYIGIKNLYVKDSLPEPQKSLKKSPLAMQDKTRWHAFGEGFLANVLNPKCTIFMLSIFTVVISPQTGTWMKLGYGLEIMLIALLWFCFLSISITLSPIQKKLSQAQKSISRFTGLVLIALGIRVALEKNH